VLIAATVIQSIRDIRGGDPYAEIWLESDGLFFLSALGVEYDTRKMRHLVESGRLNKGLLRNLRMESLHA